MDKFESTLIKIIDQFVALQAWSAKPEKAKQPKKIFPTILDLDLHLKTLRRLDKAHPLQELHEEVRALFNTPEFRAILLAAFNWRSAARKKALPNPRPVKQVEGIRAKKNRRSTMPIGTSVPKKKKTRVSSSVSKSPKKTSPTQPDQERSKLQEENTKKFIRQVLDYIDSIPASTRKQMLTPKTYVDMYQAGRRQYGSYGSKQ